MLFKKEGMSKFLFILNNLQKTYIKIQFYSKSFERIAHFLWAEEQMSDLLKKSVICSFSLLSWAPWSNCSLSLICPEQSERFAYCRSFVLSDLSDLLTVPSKWVMSKWQCWEFAHLLIAHSLIAHSLIAHLLICSLLICSFAHLLKSLRSNEQLWAICSDCSGQVSNCEQIAKVAQDKWATVRESLRLLMTKEQPWVICSGRSW